ncbi:MAG: LTA synthase family protein [Thermodesulfobacteriota bacterium]
MKHSDSPVNIWALGSCWPAALGFTGLYYVLLQVVTWVWFDVAIQPRAIPMDLLAHLLLGAALFALARGPVWFVSVLLVLFALLQLVNAAKVAILGGPVMPDDFRAVRSLFLILHGWQFALLTGLSVSAALLLLGMLQLHRRRAWFAAGLLGTVMLALFQLPAGVTRTMDRWFGNSVWDQQGNFQSRGLLFHLMHESARYLALQVADPTPGEVGVAVEILKPGFFVPAGFEATDIQPRRNIHMIVLESFWDPALLSAAELSQDPLDPRFRALWAASENSHGLSPVFGGYTANAEFEALCGFPVTQDAVFFEGRLRQDANCLPRHLAAEGYTTVASHPNVAMFWNRVHAYRRVGFQNYWSRDSFALDDMNREFLSDASLYRQVLTRIQPLLESGVPMLNYVLTFFGHQDYPLGPARPPVISATSASPLVESYANTIYYKSRELMDFLEVLRQLDPHGLIVLFGDHLPFLGHNYEAFVESNLLAADRGAFSDDMFATMTQTPLIIIDGEAGPVPLGNLPLYRLPDIILGLLGDSRPTVMSLTRTPSNLSIRPLPGMQYILSGDNIAVCRDNVDDSPLCRGVAHWLDAVEKLTEDLYSGRQYLLLRTAPPEDGLTL